MQRRGGNKNRGGGEESVGRARQCHLYTHPRQMPAHRRPTHCKGKRAREEVTWQGENGGRVREIEVGTRDYGRPTDSTQLADRHVRHTHFRPIRRILYFSLHPILVDSIPPFLSLSVTICPCVPLSHQPTPANGTQPPQEPARHQTIKRDQATGPWPPPPPLPSLSPAKYHPQK